MPLPAPGVASACASPVATTISIPKLGVAMTEGSLVEWLVEDGAIDLPMPVVAAQERREPKYERR